MRIQGKRLGIPLLLLLILFSCGRSYAQPDTSRENMRISVNGTLFQGESFTANQNVFVELIPFLRALRLDEASFDTGDLRESRDGRACVSLEGAATSLGGKLNVDWKNSSAQFTFKSGNALPAPRSPSPQNPLPPSPETAGKLSIYVNDQQLYAPYFVEGHDVYVALVPLARALGPSRITFYLEDLKQTQNGKTYISLQGEAAALGGTLKINWETGVVDFNAPQTPVIPSQGTVPENESRGNGYSHYYGYYPPYPYYGCFSIFPYGCPYPYSYPFPGYAPYNCWPFWCGSSFILLAPSGVSAGIPNPPAPTPSPPSAAPIHPPFNRFVEPPRTVPQNHGSPVSPFPLEEPRMLHPIQSPPQPHPFPQQAPRFVPPAPPAPRYIQHEAPRAVPHPAPPRASSSRK